jgi:hypothetical protein
MRDSLVRDPLGKFEHQALLSTKQEYSPKQLLEGFVRRWQMEVTFEEARAHLGVETQRQWSDLAIARTTPILLGLFSLVTILAHHLQANFSWKIRQTIWYSKPLPTFSDALALVRRFFWASTFSISRLSKLRLAGCNFGESGFSMCICSTFVSKFFFHSACSSRLESVCSGRGTLNRKRICLRYSHPR